MEKERAGHWERRKDLGENGVEPALGMASEIGIGHLRGGELPGGRRR